MPACILRRGEAYVAITVRVKSDVEELSSIYQILNNGGYEHMGFFDALEKIVDGICDFSAKIAEHTANSIDRMSDDEVEKKYSESAEIMRAKAEMWRTQAEMWQMRSEERKMRAEMSQMEEEQIGEYHED